MLKLEAGWVGQNQLEHCLNLEILNEKMDASLIFRVKIIFHISQLWYSYWNL